MALSPETLKALGDALDAVVAEAGDSPEYAALVEDLKAAGSSLDAVGGGEPDGDPVPPRDGDEDDYSFETAQKRHAEKRKPKTDGEDEKENPFS